MMPSAAWGIPCLAVLPRCTRSATWCRAVESPLHYNDTRRVVNSAGAALQLYCSRMSARLARIDYDACTNVLQAHDGPHVRRLGNVRACIGN
jgi:hypothetical protein